MTKAAIYVRYSSSLQKEASIEDQIRLCRSHAEAQGLDVVEVFTDHAISGGHLANRPGAMALMNRARDGIAATALEERVLDGLRSILVGNDALLDEFAKAFRAEFDRLRKTRGSRGIALQRELAKVERGIRRCLDFIVGGEGDPGSVATTLKDLEAQKAVLDADLKQVAETNFVDIHPNVGELYRRKVGELQGLLAGEATRVEAMGRIRELIERIEIHPGAKRGQPEVILVGALASLLDFACAKTTTAANGNSVDGGRVLMVAGVGFEPTTFRL
jgi:site-specific DNA recombinase